MSTPLRNTVIINTAPCLYAICQDGQQIGRMSTRKAAVLAAASADLFDLVKKLALLRDGLANGNASAEQAAADLAAHAHDVVTQLAQDLT